MFTFNSDVALCADNHSKEDGGMDECSINEEKSGKEGNCNDYINILDGTECLWQISGSGDGASLNSFLSNSTANSIFEHLMMSGDINIETAKVLHLNADLDSLQ